MKIPRVSSLSLPGIVALLLASPAAAGVGVWTPLGPDGASAADLIVDPTDPLRLYAGTATRGLFTYEEPPPGN